MVWYGIYFPYIKTSTIYRVDNIFFKNGWIALLSKYWHSTTVFQRGPDQKYIIMSNNATKYIMIQNNSNLKQYQ